MSLKKLREEKGLTRRFVAKKLEVHPDHITSIEGGRARLTEVNAVKLAEIYQVDVSAVIKASGQLITDEIEFLKKIREM